MSQWLISVLLHCFPLISLCPAAIIDHRFFHQASCQIRIVNMTGLEQTASKCTEASLGLKLLQKGLVWAHPWRECNSRQSEICFYGRGLGWLLSVEPIVITFPLWGGCFKWAHPFPDSGRNFCLGVHGCTWQDLHIFPTSHTAFVLVLYVCYQELQGVNT